MSNRSVPPPPTKYGPAVGAAQAKRHGFQAVAAPVPVAPPGRIVPPPPPRFIPPPRVAAGAAIQRATDPRRGAAPAKLQAPPPPDPRRPLAVQRMELDSSDDSGYETNSDGEAESDDEKEEISTGWWDTGLELRGGSQAGWALPGENLYVREGRSYASDRDRQLLRHFSSQLFFLAKGRINSAQEIQTMVANGNLFVAANADGDIEAIYNWLASDLAGKLRTALTTTWKSDPSGAYWLTPKSTKKKSTARFARKFERLYSGKRTAKLQSGHVAIDPTLIWGIIQGANIETLKGWKKGDVVQAFAGSGKIFLLYAGNDGRHAEEKLMDLLELAKHNGVVLIAGKKRPCKTCLGRLRYMVSEGFKVTHSQCPGFIWKERYEAQPEEVKKFSLDVIRENQSYITIRSKNKKPKGYSGFRETYSEKPDFASDSDSDG
jgi:hypothetical protein